MVDDVLAAPEPEFGVVLIERGSEVGGGDVRTMVGCVGRVVDAGRSEDGRWAIVAAGVRRIAVREWLPDDPYPRAVVEDLPDDAGTVRPAALEATESRLRRVAALATELGGPALDADLELAEDHALRTFQFGVLAPIGALDRQKVLLAAGPAARLALVDELLAEQEELLRGRLALGEGPDDG
jgi:Lon protease-like protein